MNDSHVSLRLTRAEALVLFVARAEYLDRVSAARAEVRAEWGEPGD